jgi:ABC-type glycerol-3-phosphate transport system substrate-binding protein
VSSGEGKVTYEGTPGWHQALQSILDLQAGGCFEPSPATVNAATAYGVFDSGQAAMMINRSVDTATNISQANPSLNLGFFPFPGQNAKLIRILLNPADTLAVSAASPVRQQARRSPARAR